MRKTNSVKGATTYLVLALLAGTLLSRIATAQEYDIHLTADGKVGDKYRLTSTGRNSEKMTMLVGNEAVNNRTDEFTTDLVSSVTVMEAKDNRIATKLALVIEKCSITKAGETKSLIETGRIVIATREGEEEIFKIDDVPVDAITKKALSITVPLDDVDVTDDDIFGTREKKSVGDSWKINAALAVKSLEDALKVSTSTANVKGTTTLEGVVKTGREEHLIVSAWISIDSFSVPLPNGFKIQDGQVNASFSGKFPIKPTRERFEESLKMTAGFTAVGPSDPKSQGLVIQGFMERSVSRQMEPSE